MFSHPDGDTEGQSETLPLSTAVRAGRCGGEVWFAAKDDLPHLSSQPLPAADP